MKKAYRILGVLVLLLSSCGSENGNSADEQKVEKKVDFQPWVLEDSSRIEAFKSGLQMYMVKKGPGNLPKAGNNVRVHYHGMLKDGTVFDSSFERDQPLLFTVGSGKMIPGFSEGIRRMPFGSQAILYIPPDLGYGPEGNKPNIPGNSALIFHVELLGTF